MVSIGLFSAIALAGGLVALCAWFIWATERRRARRSLASALIGEIAAAMREIEVSNIETTVEVPNGQAGNDLVPIVAEAHFPAWKANAANIVWFPSPIPRKVAYACERLEALTTDLCALRNSEASDQRTDKARQFASEMESVLRDCTDALRDLRPYVTKPPRLADRLPLRGRRTGSTRISAATLRRDFLRFFGRTPVTR